ncbi:MAG: hypothetical protein HC869_22255, partial [Rhodospirillales bacterium]|nr:hypothetical protein [Rhodospirillales bacterium]
MSGAVVLFSLGALGWAVRRRDATWYDPTSWTALVAACTSLFFFTLYLGNISLATNCPQIPGRLPDCRQNYMDGVYAVVGISWRVWGAIAVLAIGTAVYLSVSVEKTVSIPERRLRSL